jgi:plastocyanin
MSTRWRLTAAMVALAMTTACSQESTAPVRTPPPDAKRVDASKAATLTGRVTIDGPVPANAPLKMTGDAVCDRGHKEGATFDTFLSENGGLGNVFVYVKDGLGNYFFDTPSESVKLDQKGCMYQPHVFGVQVGQNVEIVNSDPTLHTVHAAGNANPEFQFSQQFQTQKDVKFFTKLEVMVRFKCDVHPWMSAYAGVLEHPYFAVTKPEGSFEMKNLPAGTYTIEAWHEKLGIQTQSVTVADSEKKAIAFTFKSAATEP